ncbi:methyl-accepting chemotaxis protein [Vibrio cholerae]|nr:methyl-accepting chemotaxis protein [Vibrio cholerae]EJL6442139.1 methyl-accepting chemotaxis protein [Vibrio cholerae]EKF9663372.1 methyl-accepting chemotaxis protein [Vibrio cholerae]
MNIFLRLKVSTRLAIGFGILVFLMLLLTTLGIQKVNLIDSALSQMTDVNAQKQRYAINYRGSVHDRAIAIRDVSMARDASELAALEREITQLEKFYSASESNMEKMLNGGIYFTEKEREILKRINNIKRNALPLVAKVIADKKENKDTVDLVLDQAKPAFVEWLAAINDFIDYQESLNQVLTPKVRSEAGGFQTLMLWLSGFSLILSVIVALLIERSFRVSLGGEPFIAQQAIQKIASGELSQPLRATYEGSILHSLELLSAKLTGIVSNIIDASREIADSTEEVSNGSSRVLQSAQSQALLTKQTADRLEEMRRSIDQIADIANQTEANSLMTTENAREGRSLVFSVAQQMQNIAITVNSTVEQVKLLEVNVKDIGGIVNVISSISEQTNLLALNAAIEAARAGESGRGFAVVADEVRQLAQRTGEATAQIETLINQVQTQTALSVKAMQDTQPQVEEGNQKTSQASGLLVDIERQAEDTLTRIRGVVSATQDQVEVVGNVVSDVEKISKMSADSIDFMVTNDHASRELGQLSARLKEEVLFFKL